MVCDFCTDRSVVASRTRRMKSKRKWRGEEEGKRWTNGEVEDGSRHRCLGKFTVVSMNGCPSHTCSLLDELVCCCFLLGPDLVSASRSCTLCVCCVCSHPDVLSCFRLPLLCLARDDHSSCSGVAVCLESRCK